MKITSVFEFMQWIEKHSTDGIYRGHLNEAWVLQPSIVRYYKQSGKRTLPIAWVEEELIGEFEKYSIPYKDYRLIPYLEKLVDAQHFGLPTRLLDWTTNPLKGLFFAVENPDFDAVNGVVYLLEPDSWWIHNAKDIVSDYEHKLAVFFPALLNERLSAQEGCFTAFPLSNQDPVKTNDTQFLPLSIENYPDDLKSLEKIGVEAKSKKRIRIELDKFGINHRTMFPGLDGVAKWVKADYSSLRH